MEILMDKQFSAGIVTGRNWKDIITALMTSGSLQLNKGESITGISVHPKYGLMFRIESNPTQSS